MHERDFESRIKKKPQSFQNKYCWFDGEKFINKTLGSIVLFVWVAVTRMCRQTGKIVKIYSLQFKREKLQQQIQHGNEMK